MNLLSVCLTVFLAVFCVRPLYATIGLAEWEIRTPGGNLISHVDPIKRKHGTCLRKPDKIPGVVHDDQMVVYVSHLRWWQYFRDHVVGGTGQGGYFIFNERAGKARFFPRRDLLFEEIGRLKLGKPLNKKMLPDDGWAAAWERQLPKPSAAEIRKQKDRRKSFCKSLKSRVEGEKVSELDWDEYEIRCLQEK